MIGWLCSRVRGWLAIRCSVVARGLRPGPSHSDGSPGVGTVRQGNASTVSREDLIRSAGCPQRMGRRVGPEIGVFTNQVPAGRSRQKNDGTGTQPAGRPLVVHVLEPLRAAALGELLGRTQPVGQRGERVVLSRALLLAKAPSQVLRLLWIGLAGRRSSRSKLVVAGTTMSACLAIAVHCSYHDRVYPSSARRSRGRFFAVVERISTGPVDEF